MRQGGETSGMSRKLRLGEGCRLYETIIASRVRVARADRLGFEAVPMGVSRFEPQRVEQSQQ